MPLELAQRQTQALSARMIQSISVLAMPALELREFIRDAAEQNPALEVAAEEPPPLPLRLKPPRPAPFRAGTPARTACAVSTERG